jgi:methylated-DNA-[protein]-cysteine S-methyltransferase
MSIALSLDRVRTPIGDMLVVTDDAGRLHALDWDDHAARLRRLLEKRHRHTRIQVVERRAPAHVRVPLRRYVDGTLDAIDAIPVDTGGTDFQRAVWEALRGIPAGTTLSYGALAAKIGCPRAVRAVGHANGANPISVVIPCHRLIGADGTLTGYGGGLERKRWLLAHEGADFADWNKSKITVRDGSGMHI